MSRKQKREDMNETAFRVVSEATKPVTDCDSPSKEPTNPTHKKIKPKPSKMQAQ